ncbi:MAG TPA: UrcA family protein [Rhizomicrobium sp.]|nr:UrcA family protein [Rhizomicrobium sp.]
MRNILISAVAVLVLGHASAQAQSATENQVIVNYGDLDVATADGAQILVKRVEIASAEVCGYQPSLMDISALQAFRACSAAAETRAIKTLPVEVSQHISGIVETVAER